MCPSAPYLCFYLSNARQVYLSMGKLCSLMGQLIKDTKSFLYSESQYFVGFQVMELVAWYLYQIQIDEEMYDFATVNFST